MSKEENEIIQKIQERLQSEARKLLQKKAFMNDHNFKHEANHIEIQYKVVREIEMEINSVLKGNREPENMRLEYE